MRKTKIRWGRILAIALILTVLDIVIHDFGQKAGITPDFQEIVKPSGKVIQPKPLDDKEWAAKNFLPLLALTFVLTFGCLAAIFAVIQEKVPGKRLAKGFRYGIAFWGLWALGILEWHYIYKSGWAYDLFNTAFLDAGFLLVVSLVAARFLATDSPVSEAKKPAAVIAVVPIIAILYLVGRYFNYVFFDIVSAQHIFPVQTFICLLLVGCWVGVMYLLLDQALEGDSPLKRALMFGLLIFGTNWWFFNQFELLLMEISWADPALRVGVDAVMVGLGVFIFEKFVRKTA